MKRESGFTLIEVIVALAVLAILLVIAVPAFRTMTTSNKLTTNANEVLMVLRSARSEAVKRNRQVSFCQHTGVTTSLDNACNAAATTSWTSWSSVAAETDGTAVELNARALDDSNSVAIVSAQRITFSGTGIGSVPGATTPYTGLVAELNSTSLSGENRRCIYMVGGSSMRVEAVSGACP